MLSIAKPREADYGSYAAYVLAAVGYLACVQGAAGVDAVERCGCSGCNVGIRVVGAVQGDSWGGVMGPGACGESVECGAWRFGDGVETGGCGSVRGGVHDVGSRVGGDAQYGGVCSAESTVGVGEARTGCVSRGSNGLCAEASAREQSFVKHVGTTTELSGSGAETRVSGSAGISCTQRVGARGRNWERNQQWKREKRDRKNKRQAMGVDWRVRAQSPSVSSAVREEVEQKKSEPVVQARVGFGRGYFSDCSEETQKQLKESRARMLIAENERKAIEAERRVSQLKSPAQLAADVVALVERVEKMAKAGRDDKMTRWAQEVTTASASTLASSAPSSVPSVESVSTVASSVASSKFAFTKKEATRAEGLLLANGIEPVQLVQLRIKTKRALDFSDFLGEKVKIDLDGKLRDKLYKEFQISRQECFY